MPTTLSTLYTRVLRFPGFPALSLFAISLLVLLRTAVPTIYTLDSGEFVIGASKLGFVHAPGYPLFILLLHLFQQLPFADIGYSGNLFSALCLALAVVCTYQMLRLLLHDRWLAWITALIFAWGYYIWLVGLFTEVYTPQLVTLALAGWATVALLSQSRPGWRAALLAGSAYGLAVTMNPTSIFLAGGLVAAFCVARLRWSQRITAGMISILIFASLQLYFPVRYVAQPIYNLAGQYTSNGVFVPINLGSLNGLTWMITGRQFGNLFFADGIIPPLSDFLNTLMLFVQNTLGFGLVFGGIGLMVLFRYSRAGFVIWYIAFIPYLYFYTSYGAGDKLTMFGPVFWLWSIPIGYGLRWLLDYWKAPTLRYVLIILPLLLLIVNFPHLDLSTDYSVRQRTEAMMKALPANAIVFGHWGDIVPVEYLHIIEGSRPDITVYNQFLFTQTDLHTYIDSLVMADKPVVLINSITQGIQLTSDTWDWLIDGYHIDIEPVPLGPNQIPLYIYYLHAPV
ncbi:MAG: DUF2723 domain-containing protein [Anaerolineae bacterium]|nr:DUF2723 domain-containing protein [Anaerolineae bacterium]